MTRDKFENYNIWHVKVPKSNKTFILNVFKLYTTGNKTFLTVAKEPNSVLQKSTRNFKEIAPNLSHNQEILKSKISIKRLWKL